MKNEKFISSLKNGGFTIVIIYSIFSIALQIIFNILSVENAAMNFFGGVFGVLVVFMILLIVLYVILTAGLYGSSNDIIEGKPASFKTFFQNGKRYFWSTVGFSFLYLMPFIIVMSIFYYLIPFVRTSPAASFLLTFVIQAVLTPLIILNVIGKTTKEYIKKNYAPLLIFSLIVCSINLIPIAGEFLFIILNAFYPLLIISMCDNTEYAVCTQ